MNLEELIDLANQYGNISVFQCAKDMTWNVNITFRTINHVELKATSGHYQPSLKVALEEAIKAAEKIVESLQTYQPPKRKLIQ